MGDLKRFGAPAALIAGMLCLDNPVAAVSPAGPTFSFESIQGSDGTSWVYLRAHEDGVAGRSTAVPARRLVGCPTTFYMRWTNVRRSAELVSYDVQLYRCRTNQPYDDGVSRGGAIRWSAGARTLLAGERSQEAGTTAIYDLAVALDPASPPAGQASTLRAAVEGDFVERADRTLGISVDPHGWSVAGWDLDFGDGQRAVVPERSGAAPGGVPGPPSLQVSHVYGAAGPVVARATAHVAGLAQVGDFDPATGEPVILNEAFAVDVTNTAGGQVLPPAAGYVPPLVDAAVVPALSGEAPAADAAGLTAIEVPRGTPVSLWVRPRIDREGYLAAAGSASASGSSRLLSWRLVAGSLDGPPGQVTQAGTPAATAGGPGDPIVQQWDSPDRLAGGAPLPYRLVIAFTMRTTYADGTVRDFDLSGAIEVSVRFAATGG